MGTVELCAPSPGCVSVIIDAPLTDATRMVSTGVVEAGVVFELAQAMSAAQATALEHRIV